MKYELEYGGQFLKDLKLAKRRGLNMKDLSDITDMLQEGKALPKKCRDHILTGNYKGYRECHINPDWLLLIQKIVEATKASTFLFVMLIAGAVSALP
ncbi:MAG: type II toxin-antitoxin system YafQ family toxin [Prevotella sp.]|nr:type II toxin-antitoxin system YafQ family toxin [Prevotella sp.]MBR6189203.1 type II toxin-antitoxin system YafQ family toxin [Prevotella sp.]